MVRRWPGDVTGWPVFKPDEAIFDKIVHRFMMEKVNEGPEAVSNVSLNVLRAEVAQVLRRSPQDTRWIALSEEMKRLIEDFFNGEDGWLEQAKVKKEIKELKGAKVTVKQQEDLYQLRAVGRMKRATVHGLEPTRQTSLLRQAAKLRTVTVSVIRA